jgi:pyridoxine kinase
MEKLKRIAAIHDISCLGKCSLTVALPVISASGVECAVIPTALLSTHTGEFSGYSFRDLSGDMLPVAEHWSSEKIEFDGIYSGYLASAQQEQTLEQIIDLLATEKTKIIVDPVMADNGEYYSGHGEDMCVAFRRLCSRADIITPNVTEAALLTGIEYRHGPHPAEYIDALIEGLKKYCRGVIAITGVRPDAENVGVAALDTATGAGCVATRPVAPGIFYGTGDIFASAFSALIVRGADLNAATDTALSLVGESIDLTVKRGRPRRFGVDFEFAMINYVNRVDKLFR